MDAREFLNNHRLGDEFVDSGEILGFFFSEMKKGLDGEESSLKMIPTYAGTPEKLLTGESVIVMDAGGTNFRTCLVTFDEEGKPVISDFKRVGMPGVEKEVSAEEFYSIFADSIERFMGKSGRIGFCFSYAAEITEDHDGIPLLFSKEVKAPETIGKPLGKNILAVLEKRGYDVSFIKLSVVNDTVATLLAAKAESAVEASSYVGFILGTGTNTAYIEKNGNIGKIALSDGNQIINTESGSLRIELTDLDKGFLQTTRDPNTYHMEKMISGAYLGPFCHYVISEAVKESVFSLDFAENFSTLDSLSTSDVGAFLGAPYNKENVLGKAAASDRDVTYLYTILKKIVVRAAKLTAINLTAAALKGGVESSPAHPVVINADGTTFYKLPFLERYTRYYLDKILEEENGCWYRMVNIDSSPIIGAAISALAL